MSDLSGGVISELLLRRGRAGVFPPWWSAGGWPSGSLITTASLHPVSPRCSSIFVVSNVHVTRDMDGSRGWRLESMDFIVLGVDRKAHALLLKLHFTNFFLVLLSLCSEIA